jgi:CxxC-x17-CxxC domain-containing protein
MNNFKKEGFRKGGSGFGGKPSFGGPKKFGGSDRGGERGGFDRGGRPSGEKELFKATCSSCHKSCEVPFRPSGDKPVYCRECYRDNSQSDTHAPQRGEGRGGDFRKEARPFSEERPSYREEVRAPRDTGTDDIKRQLAKIESKMDFILSFINTQKSESENKAAPAIKIETLSVETPKKVRKPKTEKVKAAPKKKVTKKKSK